MAITIVVDHAEGADYLGAADHDMTITGTISLGAGYTTGGVTVPVATLLTALRVEYPNSPEIDEIVNMGFDIPENGGCYYHYEQATGKVAAYNYDAHVVPINESLVVSSNTTTLTYPPLTFTSIVVTAGSPQDVGYSIIFGGTPKNAEVAVSGATLQTLDFKASNSVTACDAFYLRSTGPTASSEIANGSDLSPGGFHSHFRCTVHK